MPRIILFIIIASTIIAGCASSKETAHPANDPATSPLTPMPDDSAISAVRRLESDPLAPEAAALRKRLFEWLLISKNLHDFDASTAPIEELEGSSYPYKDELMMQYLFGGAVWRLGAGEKWTDLAAQQEAGIRSMIAAYRNLAQLDGNLRDIFLDRLDELRRRGELRGYIEEKNNTE